MPDGTSDENRASGEAVSGVDLPARVAVLLVLSVVGLGLAGAGVVLGFGETLDDSGGNPEIAVSGDNITVATDGAEPTTVMNMSDVSEVEITVTDTEFRIQVERAAPLSKDEHERAAAIALGNDTVMEALGEFDDHEVSVQPVRELGTDPGGQLPTEAVSGDVALGSNQTASGGAELQLADSTDRSVTIRRRSTATGQAVVVTITTSTQRRSLTVDSTEPTRHGAYADIAVTHHPVMIDLEGERIIEIMTPSKGG